MSFVSSDKVVGRGPHLDRLGTSPSVESSSSPDRSWADEERNCYFAYEILPADLCTYVASSVRNENENKKNLSREIDDIKLFLEGRPARSKGARETASQIACGIYIAWKEVDVLNVSRFSSIENIRHNAT